MAAKSLDINNGWGGGGGNRRHPYKLRYLAKIVLSLIGERGGLMVNASDSVSRGRGFEPHSGRTVLCL